VTSSARPLLIGLDYGDVTGSWLASQNEASGPEVQTHDAARLLTPVDCLPDAWPVLRGLRQYLNPGARLECTLVGDGDARMSRNQLLNLLHLTGYQMQSQPSNRRGTGRYVAVKVERSAATASCTVIVPCRNEVDNVAYVVDRVPRMGTASELVFVDGNSTDGTPERVEELILKHPEKRIRLVRQREQSGKAGAVFLGFREAHGDVVMILDADMTVAPEDLPRFYLAVAEGVTDFANGTRFVYPMETGAMPRANNAGNRIFGMFLSWALGMPISDSLCGTKAFWRRSWPAIDSARKHLGGHDPWGDFELLFGAAHAGLRITDIPIRYWAREAGESKMRPVEHGVELAKTCVAGVRLLKLGGFA